MTREDLTGRQYSFLTVLSFDHKNDHGESYWKCRCQCGNTTVVRKNALTRGEVKSCGCWRKAPKKHGMTPHGYRPKIYKKWANMKSRCTNPNVERYPHYGGRGIKVCEEWANSFESFYEWAMKNGYQDDLQIDRIDNDGDYCPENCQWITAAENLGKTGRARYITAHRETHSLAEWGRITGLQPGCIAKRLKRGWSPERAIPKSNEGDSKCLQ